MHALEVALYRRLSEDVALMGRVADVYTAPTTDPHYPYVRISKVSSAPDYTYRLRTVETYLYDVRIVDRGEARDTALQALGRVQALLDLGTLAVEGGRCLQIRRVGDLPDVVELDDDGVPLVQVGASYRIVIADEGTPS